MHFLPLDMILVFLTRLGGLCQLQFYRSHLLREPEANPFSRALEDNVSFAVSLLVVVVAVAVAVVVVVVVVVVVIVVVVIVVVVIVMVA